MCKTRFGSQGVILYGFKAKQIVTTVVCGNFASKTLVTEFLLKQGNLSSIKVLFNFFA